jgi:hypothetical protein
MTSSVCNDFPESTLRVELLINLLRVMSSKPFAQHVVAAPLWLAVPVAAGSEGCAS